MTRGKTKGKTRGNLLGHEIDMIVGNKAIARAMVIDVRDEGDGREALLNVINFTGNSESEGKPWWFPEAMIRDRRKPVYDCPNGVYWKIKVEDL